MHHMTSVEITNFAALCSALLYENNLLDLSVLDPTTINVLEHRQLLLDPWYKTTWDTLYAIELGCICQGIGSGEPPSAEHVAGTNTFFCIGYHDILAHKRKEICHKMVVCEVCPEKDVPNCTRVTIGGNRICYPGDVGTNIVWLELLTLLLNSVISWKGIHFSSINLNNFDLDTLMPGPKYVHIKSWTSLMSFLTNTS
jgi:hypothetical protein